MTIGLIVHGGAGFLKDHDPDEVMAACRRSVQAGQAALRHSGSALDAVETAVRVMEADPLFNAGYGSILNRAGFVEMDALVMDGRTYTIGAVALVRRVRHPVSLARLVMERSEHHLLAGPGAEQFAAEQGVSLVPPETMIAPHRALETNDTVGAVALDGAGNVAVAVSTGGTRGKLPGRIGDSPVAGAGGYADNQLGGACATGVGEGIMRALLTFRAVEALSRQGAQAAADEALAIFGEQFEGSGGLIVLDRRGGIGIAHNTPYMPVAWLAEDGSIPAQVQQSSAHPMR